MKNLICKRLVMPLLAAVLVLVAGGCESSDQRLTEFAIESSAQQSAQNQTAAELQRDVSEDHRRVVEAVEQSRQAVVLLERDLQKQRDRIDTARHELASERHRESLLAPVLAGLGPLLLVALPLVLCWYLLHALRTPSDDTGAAAAELLMENLQQPDSQRPRLGGESQQRLAGSPSPPTASDPALPPF